MSKTNGPTTKSTGERWNPTTRTGAKDPTSDLRGQPQRLQRREACTGAWLDAAQESDELVGRHQPDVGPFT